MFFRLFLAFPGIWLVMAHTELAVKWTDEQRNTVKIIAATPNQTLMRCMDSGLEVQYRFELQACKRRDGWFHDCRDKRTIVQSVQFDPISQTYRIERDRIGDGLPGEEQTIREREQAFLDVSQIAALPVEYLSQGDLHLARSRRAYLSVRVLADCRSEYSETLVKLGYFITLGLVRVGAYNSGWVDFSLAD